MKPFLISVLCLVFIAFASGLYIHSQAGRFSTDASGFGVMLTKGGYRYWLLSFCDGYEYGQKTAGGKWVFRKPLCFDLHNGTIRYGYRTIPRFTHLDTRNFTWTNMSSVMLITNAPNNRP